VILTLTLNAALDVSYEVDALVPGASHRVRAVRQRAGGKGINVARILHAAGYPVRVGGFAGGASGDVVRTELTALGMPETLLTIAAESRRTVSVVSRATGEATLLNEPGPLVTDAEWQRMLATTRQLATSVRVIVMCGSLPPGVPPDAYAQLVAAARAAGAVSIVDADGAALAAALPAGPDVVMPNAAELTAASGIEERRAAIERLRTLGAAAVVATFGAEGLTADTPLGSWRGWLSQPLVAVNPTGAGDACAAAVAAGLFRDASWPELLKDAVAWSAASVTSPVAGEVDADVVDRMLPSVRLEVFDGSRSHR
jgi:tagatose 6-phosphate kinase